MTKQKKQLTKQSIRADDVFKVKNKSVKKQNRGKAIKTKSRQALQDGRQVLDDQFLQIRQQQSCDKVRSTSRVKCRQQAVSVDDTTDQLAKL